MSRISQVRENRHAHARAIRDLMDKNKASWGPAQQSIYDSHFSTIERLDIELASLERERAGEIDPAVQTEIDDAYRTRSQPRDELTDTWMRRGDKGLTDDQRRAIQATLSTTTGSQGGFTVPSLVANQWADLLKDYSSMRRVATVIRTPTGNVFGYPISDGTSETAEILAENAAASALDPSFATASLQTWKYSGKTITVPFELLQDAQFDITTFVLRRFAMRIGRLSNTHFAVGSGTGQPTGITGAAGSGKVGTTGETLTVIHDDIVDLVHSVDPAYRGIPQGLCFMMSDAAFKVCRKLKDSQGRPLYLPADGVQAVETLMGYLVNVNNDVAVMAANAKSIFFGNFAHAYVIRDSLDLVLLRFEDSTFVSKGQVGFLAIARIGGNVIDANAVRYFANSAT